MLELASKALLAYLLGAVVGSLVVGHVRGGVDIRMQGSGNAGGTNALRTQGFSFAFWVMLIDVGKGALAVAVLPGLPAFGFAPDPGVDRDWLRAACAVAVVLGHVYPVWHDFRGGKGAATFVGVLLGWLPGMLVPMLAVWLLTVMLTGFVGLATMLAGIALPIGLWLRGMQPTEPAFVLAVWMALFVAYTHRANIVRMLGGTEGRAGRLWLLRPR